MKVKTKTIDTDLTDISNAWQMIAYILRYCKMELFIILLLIILGTVSIMNVSYNKKDGLEVKPTIKIEATKEIKK
jgi:hypothetical protein